MYNRYIPQPDGSYRKRSVPDVQPSRQRQEPPGQTQTRQEPPPGQTPPKQEPPRQQASQSRPSRPQPPRQEFSAGSFLKNLLPRDFCTEDLIVVLLLLLMAGDNPRQRSDALLTMALYLLM